MQFNKKQQHAVNQLEKSLKLIAESGLIIEGMDDSLYIYNKKDLYKKEKELGDMYRAMKECDDYSVNDFDAYGDSGGW